MTIKLSTLTVSLVMALSTPVVAQVPGSGEFVRPTAMTTTQSATCGAQEVLLSLRSSPAGVTALNVVTPGTDPITMAKKISSEVQDLKLVSQIRIYCGDTVMFEILGYPDWQGGNNAMTTRFLIVGGNYLTRVPG
ncbi:MAG: hypothetical protein KKC14_04540 [Alphaproteobacteria bacterium]|nr:hypothetical protein [Alphaproteobacteria bacterium]